MGKLKKEALTVAERAQAFEDSKMRMDDQPVAVEMFEAQDMKEHYEKAQEYNKSYTIMGKEVDLFTIIGAIFGVTVPVGLCICCRKKEEKYDEMAE